MDLEFLNKLNNEVAAKFPVMGRIEQLKCDGTVNRFDSTKQGDNAIWICVHQNEYKGNSYYNAVFGNWREGVQYTCSSYEKDDPATKSKEFIQNQKETARKTKEKLEQEKQAKFKSCRDKWAPFFYNLPTSSPVHDYLKAKKINSNFHARITQKNVLFVPAWNSEGVFVGGQRIFLDPTTNKFEKRYTYGIEKLGSFCPFGDIRNAQYVYIAEGFATAASVAMAFKTRENVAVAAVWDTANLLEGAKAIRKINPNSNLIFSADRDINTNPTWHNIGERKAKFAASKLNNAIVKTVKFNEGNSEWSDYNDLHAFEGLEHVIKQLDVSETDFIEMVPLGVSGSKYYFFSTARKMIVEFTESKFNPTSLTLQAPEKYWADRYGYLVNKEGEKTNRPDWRKIIEKLGIESTKAGHFNQSKVRGAGAWEHNGDIVVNTGDKIYYNNEFFPLFNNNLKSDYFYQSGESMSLDFANPLSDSDSLKVIEAFKLLKYKNPSDYIIVLGWIFSAQIFAALPWRPHIWFTGSRGSGKSTILQYVSQMIDLSLMIQGSTASGIRQRILNNALPVIYDESEPDSDKARERMSEILEMTRQSSTNSNYEILRGTSGGRAISYNTNTTFCMGSIQLSEMNGADVSRFFVIEMLDVKNQSHEDFIKLENAMADCRNMSTGLFVRAVKMYKNHIKNIETAKMVIKREKIEARQADQLAPIVAGYWAFFDTGIMPESFVIETVNKMNFKQSDYALANDENESQKCLEDILGLQIPGRMITVGQIVEQFPYAKTIMLEDDYNQMLGLIGIKYLKDNNELFIPTTSAALRKQLERFSKFSDYKNVLKRHDDFTGYRKIRIGGAPRNGMTIKV